MKLCITCGSSFPSTSLACLACGNLPNEREGFASYTPQISETKKGYKAKFYSDYEHLESNHFWFRIRSQLIVWALRKFYPELHSFFEVSSGTGYVLGNITIAFPSAQLRGSEMFTAGLRFAAARLPAVEFIQMDAREIPFIDEFDAIGAFDVLEHIEEDECVLEQICKALKKGGVMLITVPQHAWLWSPVDDYSCHVRRYSAKELHVKVMDAGFEILRSTSFVSTLLPAMLLSRFAKIASGKDVNATVELSISPWLNFVFEKIMNAEVFIISRGVDFPIGGSRLVVARKL